MALLATRDTTQRIDHILSFYGSISKILSILENTALHFAVIKSFLIYSNGRYSCTFSNTAATSGNFLRNAGLFSFVELFDSIIERIAKIEP